MEDQKGAFKIFDAIRRYDCDSVKIHQDPNSGLEAIIAIHHTFPGRPALGGCRRNSYPSSEAAIEDALRLAKGMAYKAALAQLNLGGGKGIIVKNTEDEEKIAKHYESFGRFVDTFNGSYITGEDVGTSMEHVNYIAKNTPHVVGKWGSSEPSPFTAKGVLNSIYAYLDWKKNLQRNIKEWDIHQPLRGITFAVQGAGNVGSHVIKKLKEKGASVFFSESMEEKAQTILKEFNDEVNYVDVDKIYDVEADIFVPCALGGIINSETIRRLKCKGIFGSANNQLCDNEKQDSLGELLSKRGIAYGPDYIVNAGGLIAVSYEQGLKEESQFNFFRKGFIYYKIDGIYSTIGRILKKAQEERKFSFQVADEEAEIIIAEAKEKFYNSKKEEPKEEQTYPTNFFS